ncbi:hypothetical protein [Gemmatimonas sp.]|uniref:hypothetical protein n=1 Tax=Gemmatimonas sp. TaxID=1962908 RepID=UPI00286E35B9|nr:hypothetical protein [Gemmatimonas sp.]
MTQSKGRIVSRGRSLAVACLLLVGAASPVLAQRADNEAAGSPVRRLRYTVVGGLVGVALAAGYSSVVDKAVPPSCDPWGCAMPFLSLSGAITGLFLAREIDAQRRAERPRVGIRDRVGLEVAVLPAMPNGMSLRDSLIAIVSDSGVSLFAAEAKPRALRRRGVGLRGLRDVALLPGNERLLVSSDVALYGTSSRAGTASRLLDGAITAIAVGGDGWLAARGAAVTVESQRGGATVRDSIDIGTPAISAAYDESSASWWVGTDSALLRLDGTTGSGLRIAERISTGAGVRAIASSRDWVAVALGEAGVTAWRRGDAGGGIITPVRLQSEPRFAYDLAFYNGTLLVAGGTDGLVRIALDPTPTVLGVSRDLPFATLLKVDAKNGIWVGDRGRGTLNRVTYPDTPR